MVNAGARQQMLAMSLAILGTLRLPMLDEPSIGLAPNLVERMFQRVHEACKSSDMTAVKSAANRSHQEPRGRHSKGDVK